jgi:hypothetical protein
VLVILEFLVMARQAVQAEQQAAEQLGLVSML